MNGAAVIEAVARMVAFDAPSADRDGLRAAMGESARLQAWKDAFDAQVAAAMRVTESWPEHAVAEVQQVSLREAEKLVRRAEVLEQAPLFALALAEARITAAHVDVLANRLVGLEPEQRRMVLAHADELVAVAVRVTPDTFRRELKARVEKWVVVDAEALFERQVRATSLRSWVDDVTKMWSFYGEFDPATGKELHTLLQGRVETMFRDTTPPLAPSDPVARQQHLAALALVDLVTHGGGSVRWESLAVFDLSVDEVVDVDWGLPVEIPPSVRDRLLRDSRLECVIVANGRILHAPGKLDEGRDKRVANRAQRRALRALYRCCAVPGCGVSFDRLRMHHVVWWDHGGLTNLDNLLPVCSKHHHAIHDHGWIVELGPNRELTITRPDGQVSTTGPPSRRRPAA